MCCSLSSQNKLGFIDGTITKPTEKDGKTLAKINACKMVNSMIQSCIMNVIDPKLHKSVRILILPRNYGKTSRSIILWPTFQRSIDLKWKLPHASKTSRNSWSSSQGSWAFGTNLTSMSKSHVISVDLQKKSSRQWKKSKSINF